MIIIIIVLSLKKKTSHKIPYDDRYRTVIERVNDLENKVGFIHRNQESIRDLLEHQNYLEEEIGRLNIEIQNIQVGSSNGYYESELQKNEFSERQNDIFGNEKINAQVIKSYNVQFDYDKKNGDVKIVEHGKMLLNENEDGYILDLNRELSSKKPDDLMRIELCYNIENPVMINSNPMKVLEFPIYKVNQSEGVGILIKKGRIKYV